ncbi:hypothetical protein ACF8EF_01380 [Pseudomonas sp. zjy_15]|uniref:hypothetical protein n=1 Tax=Pseudomonas sp. zjy_15 TaxID=3367265 RepID=UPI00370B95D8
MLLSFLKNLFSKRKEKKYEDIVYSLPGTPEENTEKLKLLVVEGNEWGRSRTRETAETLGHLFSCFLLIEHKLELLLINFYPSISSCMFGQKIQVYKDFISELEKTCPYEFDAKYYRNTIAPLKQIKTLRDTLAHNIKVVDPSGVDLRQVHSYVKKMDPILSSSYAQAESESLRAVGGVATFTFLLSVDLGKLRMYLK